MQLQLLGPVLARHAGTLIPLGGRRQRAVLAVLAMRANETAGASYLVDNVWETPPARPESNLRTYITGLRRTFRDHGIDHAIDNAIGGELDGGRLVTRSGGYLIRLAPGELDVATFHELAARGDRAIQNADFVTASDSFSRALQLWRGDPVEDLTLGPAVRAEITGWEERRLTVVERRAQAMIELGQHDALIGDLRRLVEVHPYRDQLWANLMVALCRAERQAEALHAFQQVRQKLLIELGIEPGIELQTLHQRILRGDPTLTHSAGADAIATSTMPIPGTPVPRQLPPTTPQFTGRADQLAQLDALLRATHDTAMVIAAIDGTAGVGKTALAVHWAHRVAGQFPDGQLYVNLRGFDPSDRVLSAAEAVRGFLDALGVAPERIPTQPDAQTALYRSLLAEKRMLVVADNARDADHVRPLLPGTPRCVVVVTSRSRLTPLVAANGAQVLTLDVLSTVEAREVIAHRLADSRVAAEPRAVEQIVTACARLPLALAIAAAQALQTGFPLCVLAAQLAEAGGRLDALDAGDATSQVRTVFSWSYTALTPAAARLFRLLGLHCGPDITTPAVASLVGQPRSVARSLVTELVRANLLIEPAPGRYALHDLLRDYAVDLTQHHDSAPDRHAAVGRLLDHYTHTAHNADELLIPHREPIRLPLATPSAGCRPERLTSREDASTWFIAEHQVLLAALRQASDGAFHTHTWQLAWSLDTFVSRRGQWHDAIRAWQAGLSAARHLEDLGAQAFAYRLLGRADIRLGRHADAEVHSHVALELYRRAGDQGGQGHTHNTLAQLQMRQGHCDRALSHAQTALDLFRSAGNRHGEADALNGVGWHHALLGNYLTALDYCGQALPILQQLGSLDNEAATWDSLGYAQHHLGHHAEAVDCYQRALALRRELGDRYGEAATLNHLGDTHQAGGNVSAAHGAWLQALDMLDRLGHRDAEDVRAKLKDENLGDQNLGA